MKEEKSQAQLAQELDTMIARVEAVATQRNLTSTSLLRMYPDLGSTKSWDYRLKPRSFDGLNLARWHRMLSRVCTILDGGLPDEFYSTELPFHIEMYARLLKLEQTLTDRRILSCLAANGCGKTRNARWACSQSPVNRRLVRMRPTFRNKPLHIYRAMAKALGEEIKTSNVAAAEESVVGLLNKRDMTLFVDQAHEGGVSLMHILRCLVDETKSRFVYLAYDTAFRSVITGSSDALIEAKAFVGRCLKPVFDLYAAGVRVEDVRHLLVVSAGLRDAAAQSLAAELQTSLAAGTNLRLLEDAITAARIADDTDDPSPSTIKTQVAILGGLVP